MHACAPSGEPPPFLGPLMCARAMYTHGQCTRHNLRMRTGEAKWMRWHVKVQACGCMGCRTFMHESCQGRLSSSMRSTQATHPRVHALLHERLCLLQELPSKDHHTGCAVANLLKRGRHRMIPGIRSGPGFCGALPGVNEIPEATVSLQQVIIIYSIDCCCHPRGCAGRRPAPRHPVRVRRPPASLLRDAQYPGAS